MSYTFLRHLKQTQAQQYVDGMDASHYNLAVMKMTVRADRFLAIL